MARLIGRLTEVQVRRLGTGWHNDGGGLYLRVEGKDQSWWASATAPAANDITA